MNGQLPLERIVRKMELMELMKLTGLLDEDSDTRSLFLPHGGIFL